MSVKPQLKTLSWFWCDKLSKEKAQNIAVRTNHIKARIDKTQQNSECGDRDEIINHLISESRKLAQKECKIRHDWVG